MDCINQSIQTGGMGSVQRAHGWVKKRRHTLKTKDFVIVPGRIASMPASRLSSCHGLTIRREAAKLPGSACLYAGSACQAYDREHAVPELPYKKRRNDEQSVEETDYNPVRARFRVATEHHIGCTVRYRSSHLTHSTKTSINPSLVNTE